jgi:D-beta-D-heptose 7-phosphate kinase/D-beta-D-heptose 1-phosphate adenosyltransferase
MDFAGVTVLCIGDVMLDRFIYGDVDRISPEAPVPVLRLRETRTMLGGAGNVAANIASLGGSAILIGLVGEDDGARALRRHIAATAGIAAALVETGLRPTICKTRYLAHQQQVVRADEESALPLQPAEQVALLAELERALPQAAAVILSDYGKGVLDDAVITAAIGLARRLGVPVFVDPKGAEYGRYRGATCITPNARELAAASGMRVETEAEVVTAARAVMAQAQAESILATRSEKGMILVELSGAHHSVPTRAREVFDVSGAGDTVIATLALAHASGLNLVQAMRISNAAAGVVVSKVGTATVQPAELLHELDAEAGGEGAPARSAMRSLAEAAALVAHWKDQGLTVGFTNGVFDIVHAGHISLLAGARGCCDKLVLALNGDASVRRLKGPTRPVNALAQRAVVMGAIKYVDCLVSFDEDTPLALIEALLPDRLIKGGDYTVETVVGADVVQAHGGQVVLCDLVAGQSTTRIVERIRG